MILILILKTEFILWNDLMYQDLYLFCSSLSKSNTYKFLQKLNQYFGLIKLMYQKKMLSHSS